MSDRYFTEDDVVLVRLDSDSLAFELLERIAVALETIVNNINNKENQHDNQE